MAPLGLVMFSSVLLTGIWAAGPKTLKVTSIMEEPYAMSKGSELEGFCIDLLSALSKKLDFQYNIQLVKDGRYGAMDDRGQWSGMIGEVIRGEADIAVAPLTVTAKREMTVDMSKPFMQTGLSFILRKDLLSEDSQFLSLFKLFSTDMWIGVLVAYLLTSVCIFLVARISPCEWEQPEKELNSFTLSHSFWYTVGALTLQGAGPHPRGLSGRVITAIWWLFSLVLLASFFASLSSWLHSESHQLSIKTFEDLANQNVIEYGTIKDSSSMSFFKNSNNPTHRQIYEHMHKAQSYSLNADEGFRKAQKGNYAFIGESVSLDMAVARYCNLTRAPEIIGMRGYSIAAPLGSALIKNLSVGILSLSESGELDYLRSKWWASSCVARDGKSAPLKASSLKGIFLFLALGLGLGLFIALMELATKSRSVAKSQQKSCCSVLSAELSQRFRGGDVTSAEEKSKA